MVALPPPPPVTAGDVLLAEEGDDVVMEFSLIDETGMVEGDLRERGAAVPPLVPTLVAVGPPPILATTAEGEVEDGGGPLEEGEVTDVITSFTEATSKVF